MLESLGALSVLAQGMEPAQMARLAQAVSDISCLHIRRAGVTHADLRHVLPGEDGDVTVGDLSVTVSDSAKVADPTARRM